ncbi:MAG: hypothetical protein HY575_04730 [candidate division NC10 bacterium]|nr:hypothetical protein [candidate division NC10 bacterium]
MPARLKPAVAEALAGLTSAADLIEVEAYACRSTRLTIRLNYTSHLPCHGVEEPKSEETAGVALRARFRMPDGPRVGFGSAPGPPTEAAWREALGRARQGAVADPDFPGLPAGTGEQRRLRRHHDPALLSLSDEALVAAGWRVLEGALRTFAAAPALRAGDPAALGLIVGGDVTVLQERMAVGSSRLAVEADTAAAALANVTAMVEAWDAKGSGGQVAARLADLTEAAGVEAAGGALAARGGVRVPGGVLPVIFGPAAVADLLTYLILPSLSLDALLRGLSCFHGLLGERIAAPAFSLVDDGAAPGLPASRGVTCEGLPTGRTALIERGVFVGTLADAYEQGRALRDGTAAAKLGRDPKEAAAALVPRNGFRLVDGLRSAEAPPVIAPTNVLLTGEPAEPLPALLARVGQGLYLGRLWYTYPINGLRAGDFTGTAVADSFLIRDGRLAEPLAANAVRVNDNIRRVLTAVLGIGSEARWVAGWGADEVILAPPLAVAGVPIEAVGAESLP